MANTNLAQTIKQQILANLVALQTAGYINSIVEVDASKNPLETIAPQGYPLAICGMPRVTADFEDTVTNMRTYRFDIMFVFDPTALANPAAEQVEIAIDAVLDQFDNHFTLSGAAIAASLPMTIQSAPVSTGDKTLLVFVATLEARTLYTIATTSP